MSTKKMTDTPDYSMEERIISLYELQKIESKIDEVNKLKGELPLEVQDLEDDVAGLKTRLENINAEIEQLENLTKQRKREIEQAKDSIVKFEEQQNNVRNNREFDSLSKEIEYQKLEIELCEKRLKEYAVEVKVKRKQVEDVEAALADREIDLEHKKGELAVIDEETAKEIEQLEAQSLKAQARIDQRLLERYKKLRNNARNGLAVVTVRRDACGGCNNRIPPQRQYDIRTSKKIIDCEYCGRILVSDELDNK